MTRLIGTALAAGLTTVSVAGIMTLIAYDFLGDSGMRAAWAGAVSAMSRPTETGSDTAGLDNFKPEKEIHFFEEVPVEGTDLVVATGAAYASVASVEARKPLRQWCYINVGGDRPGVTARIDLGAQAGDAEPLFTPKESLEGMALDTHGLSAARLAVLAATHCRFGRLDPLS